MVKKISVRLLGEFSVQVDNKVIIENASKLTKPWQLFVYLLMKDGAITTGEELLKILWDGEDLADPANVLKNTVFAMRRELSGKAKPAQSPILFTKGGYCINTAMQFISDIKTFESLCEETGKTAKGKDLDAVRTCVAAYKGDFLPMLDSATWAVPYARKYKEMYVDSTLRFCRLLNSQSLWDELLSVASRLNIVAPLDEEGYIYTFRALNHLQMYNAIVTSYNKTEHFFEEELNTHLCDEIRQIHCNAALRVNKTEQDILIIRDDLQSALNAQRQGSGALFCNYDSFKRMFLLLHRAAVRNKGSVDVVLLTVQDLKGHAPSPQQLSVAMEELKAVIAANLRKSDTCCRYSRAQYALMMISEKKSSANHAVARVEKGFAATKSGAKLKLNCQISSVEHMQDAE
ncbi:MAG: BTAD domain-containing putative transcriptional regulator [Oscillospiraceae bacterium]